MPRCRRERDAYSRPSSGLSLNSRRFVAKSADAADRRVAAPVVTYTVGQPRS